MFDDVDQTSNATVPISVFELVCEYDAKDRLLITGSVFLRRWS